MQLNKLVGYSVFLLLAVGVGFGTMQVHQASANNFGVSNPNVGYYDGQTYNTNDRRFMFMDGVPYGWTNLGTTADMYINGMHDYLYDQGPNNVIHQQEYASARASATINMMMGVQANDPRYDLNPALQRWQNGVILAQQLFDQWAFIVRAYDRKDPLYGGSVDFNVQHQALATDQNYSGIGDPNTLNVGDPVLAPRGTAHGDYPDVVWAQLGQPELKYTIVFTNKDGSQFMIKKWCGNITGDAIPFPQDWNHVPSITGTTPQGTISGSAPTVLAFTGLAQNTGKMPSSGGILYGMVQKDAEPPKIVRQAAFTAVPPGGMAPPLPFSYPIPNFSLAGTSYCFYTTVTPSSILGGTAASGAWCYVVGYTSIPVIQGLNGDVHAGGGLCNGLLSNGNVTGSAGATSMGDYVVAASGLISNFKSNGTGGSNDLVAGASGGYSRACRPDLLQVALAGRPPGTVSLPANVDLGSYTGFGMPDVYYFDGAVLNLSGTVHSKVTIIATIGSIHIVGPILLDNSPVAAKYVPSLGLISKNDIVIDPLVTRVDAYMFANGTIDTCDPGATPGSTACSTPQLLVNGFLMAKNLIFNRLGRVNTGGSQVSEKIVLNPQIYLNPPRFFDDTSQSVLQSQGEKPPLF